MNTIKISITSPGGTVKIIEVLESGFTYSHSIDGVIKIQGKTPPNDRFLDVLK